MILFSELTNKLMKKIFLTVILIEVIIYSPALSGASLSDSLFNALKNARQDTDKVNTYIELGKLYHYSSPDSAKNFYNKAVSLSLSCNYQKGTAKSYSMLGYIAEGEGNFGKAINLYFKSLEIFKKLGLNKEIAGQYNFIGLCYNYKGDYLKAVDFLQQSLTEYSRLGDSANISKCYLNIGLAFYNNLTYDKAEEYIRNAISIKERIDDRVGLGICYLNLGNILSVKKDTKQAINYYNKSIEIFLELNMYADMAYTQTNIADIYYTGNDFKMAELYFEKALENCKKGNENSLPVYIKLGQSKLYYSTNRLDLALKTAAESIEMAKDMDILPYLKDGYMTLYEIYSSMKDYENALKYFELGSGIKDSLYNADKNKQLQELSAKYESEQKENQIKIQQAKLNASEAEIGKAETQKWAVLISAFLLAIVAGVVFYNFLRNKKANRVLQEKNEQIQQQKAEISVIAENLEALNKELEKLSIVASETDNAVIIASPDGEIEWVNDGFTRLFGYDMNEFKKMFGASLQTGSENNNIAELIERSIKFKQPITYSTLNRTKSGTNLWTQTTLTPIVKNNEIVKLIAIDTDITRLKKAEEEINLQRKEMMEMNGILEKRNVQITENITYAKKIQSALLPSVKQMQKFLDDSFVIHRPRDIVSGDFYWFHRSEGKLFVAVVDCTGHGVSGAFMSMIGAVLLNEIVVHKSIHSPKEVITELDRNVNYSLNRHTGQQGNDDGMDITFCAIDTVLSTFSYTSANQTFYYLNNNNELVTDEGDIYTVGGSLGSSKLFTEKVLPLSSVKSVYLSTDGFCDQFGGEQGQKFLAKRFISLISSVKEKSMTEQELIIERTLEEWMNQGETKYTQTDDISVIGIRLSKLN